MLQLHRLHNYSHAFVVKYTVFSSLFFAADTREIRNNKRKFIDDYNNGNNKPEIIKDEAWMTINSSVMFDIHIYVHNHECWKVSVIFAKSVSKVPIKCLAFAKSIETGTPAHPCSLKGSILFW
jgi:hypothetical protein